MEEQNLKLDDTCPLESVIQLTQASDDVALSKCLISLIEQLLPKQSVQVYRLAEQVADNPPSVKLANEDSSQEFIEVSSLPGLEDSLTCLKPVTLTLDKEHFRRIFPVFHAAGPWGFLLVEGVSLSPDHFDLIEPLLRIFSNQSFLLNQNKTDPLTGLLNRQALDSFAKRIRTNHENSNRRSNQQPTCCLALLDIDHFKLVNDTFGHLYGDEVLLLFARQMRESFRHNDLIYRYGGEEFALILHDDDLTTAEMVLERFRQRIEAYEFPQVGHKTVSIGLTQLDESVYLAETIEKADKALYYSKDNGRNQTSIFESLAAEGKVDQTTVPKDIDLF